MAWIMIVMESWMRRSAGDPTLRRRPSSSASPVSRGRGFAEPLERWSATQKIQERGSVMLSQERLMWRSVTP